MAQSIRLEDVTVCTAFSGKRRNAQHARRRVRMHTHRGLAHTTLQRPTDPGLDGPREGAGSRPSVTSTARHMPRQGLRTCREPALRGGRGRRLRPRRLRRALHRRREQRAPIQELAEATQRCAWWYQRSSGRSRTAATCAIVGASKVFVFRVSMSSSSARPRPCIEASRPRQPEDLSARGTANHEASLGAPVHSGRRRTVSPSACVRSHP